MKKFDRRYALTVMQILGPLVTIWALITYATVPLILLTILMLFLMRTVGGVITYHRIHAHGTHKMHPVVEFIGTSLGFYGTFTSPVEFCAQHITHHKYADTVDDPHSSKHLGWKTLFPILWNNSGPEAGDIRTVVRLRRNKISNLYYEHFWIMITLPALLFLISPQIFLFGYFIPFTLSIWSAALSTLNHDETGPKNMGFWYGILSGGEHMHKWHHNNPHDTSGEGWLDVLINILAKKRINLK